MTTTATPGPVPTAKTLIGEIADGAIIAFESQKPLVESLIASGEIVLETEVTKLLTEVPKPSGIEGALVGPIENAIAASIEAKAKSLVAQYGSDALYALLDAKLHAWATQLGG